MLLRSTSYVELCRYGMFDGESSLRALLVVTRLWHCLYERVNDPITAIGTVSANVD